MSLLWFMTDDLYHTVLFTCAMCSSDRCNLIFCCIIRYVRVHILIMNKYMNACIIEAKGGGIV